MISLGIDIGGTGCKCVAFRENGTQLAMCYEEYPGMTGQTTLSPQMLRESVFSVIRGCVAQLPDKSEVAAITVSSFGESFVAVDQDGSPLGDIIMYFANAENRRFDELVQCVGAERLMKITCALPDASYSLAKMLHTQETAPRPVWKFLLIASYVVYCLSGETVTDYSLACRTLLFNVRQLCWSKELLDAAGISEAQMPTVLPTGAAAGKILPQTAAALGLDTHVQIVIGSHDQIVNALGAGVGAVGDGVDTAGTCECITPLFENIPEDLAFLDDNYACVPYLDGVGYVTYAYNISGGAVIKWYRDTLASHLAAQAKAQSCSIYDLFNRTCPQTPTQLLVLPFLQGMGGTPDVLPGARGLFAGVSMQTTLPEIYRGILEGLSFEMAYNLKKLARFGAAPRTLYACGGGARSVPWLQIKADILGCAVQPSLVEETGALGSAILGFAAVTGERDRIGLARQFARYGPAIAPNPAHHAFYQTQFEEFCGLRDYILNSQNNRKDH